MSTFSKTQNIGAYASANGITKFDILKNPKNGNLFVVDSKGTTMRISKDITELSNELAISWFTPDDGIGEPSWMIHKQGTGAEVVSTLSFAPVATFNEF